jgi:hypothetical protein
LIEQVAYQADGDAIMETPGNEPTFKCLFRATDGHAIKFSTLVCFSADFKHLFVKIKSIEIDEVYILFV